MKGRDILTFVSSHIDRTSVAGGGGGGGGSIPPTMLFRSFVGTYVHLEMYRYMQADKHVICTDTNNI